MSIGALCGWLPLVSIPRCTGRAPLQLEGCLMDYIIKFTRYAIGGVAVLYLHPQEGPPLLLCGSSMSRGRWYGSAGVHPRTHSLLPVQVAYASTSPSRVGACWWILAGEEVQLSGASEENLAFEFQGACLAVQNGGTLRPVLRRLWPCWWTPAGVEGLQIDCR